MPIPIITNFEVNSASPIDTRLVATNSAALNEIKFPYDGLTVYTKDANLNYTYTAIPLGQAGFPGRWQVSSNGIYGGSGSMIGNTDVNMGSVGGNLDNKSFELVFSASSSSDRAQFVTSFIRNQSGSGFEQIELRNQVRYIDNGVLKNGPYISFNPIDLESQDRVARIAFGTPDKLFTKTVQRFTIEPDSTINNGAIVFSPSDDSNATPIYISQNSTYGNFIGANWNGSNRVVGYTGSVIFSFGGGNLDIINTDDSGIIPQTQLRIADLSSNTATNVQIRVDDFSTDAGQSVVAGRNFVIKSITDVIRTTEHVYTKTQHMGYKQLQQFFESGTPKDYANELIPTSSFSRTSEKILYVSNEGNFFDIELPDVPDELGFNTLISDIRCLRQRSTGSGGGRGSNIVIDRNDFPDGTEITIRFTYKTNPTSLTGDYIQNGYWSLGIWTNIITSRKIKSSYTDEINGSSIKLLYEESNANRPARNGDVITFKRGGGFWHITSINRFADIQKQLSNSSTLTWDMLGDGPWAPEAQLKRIVDNGAGLLTYKQENFSAVLVLTTNSNNNNDTPTHPFRFDFNDEATTSISTIRPMRPLSITKDRFNKVYIRGGFRLNSVYGNSLSKEWDNGSLQGLMNTIWIGTITDTAYLANGDDYDTSWGYCEVNIITPYNVPTGNPLSADCVTIPGRLVIDSSSNGTPGKVLLQFNMSLWKSANTGNTIYTIDVNVPMFSYSTI